MYVFSLYVHFSLYNFLYNKFICMSPPAHQPRCAVGWLRGGGGATVLERQELLGGGVGGGGLLQDQVLI